MSPAPAVLSTTLPYPTLTLCTPSSALRFILDQELDNLAGISLPAPPHTEPYIKVVLCDTPELLVVAVRWRAGGRSELHGHSSSAGLYRIMNGTLAQQCYIPEEHGFRFEQELFAAGDESYLPAGSYHKMLATSDAISLHAYAPRPIDTRSPIKSSDRAKLAAAHDGPIAKNS